MGLLLTDHVIGSRALPLASEFPQYYLIEVVQIRFALQEYSPLYH